ncbi:MAG: prepilin peptidase [Alphaproteobacteria bacterium]|nr:prepilin peptidase [Alphaproteobacteria bacterium]
MTLPGSAAFWAAPFAGLLFGSFAALAGYRLPRGEGVVGGRSRCPSCDSALGARDLVPVVSWLVLRGRCAVCKMPISPRYPAAELGSAGLFALAALAYGESWNTVTACALALGLVIIVLADLDKKIIPDLVLLWLLPAGLAHLGPPPTYGRHWRGRACGRS